MSHNHSSRFVVVAVGKLVIVVVVGLVVKDVSLVEKVVIVVVVGVGNVVVVVSEAI